MKRSNTTERLFYEIKGDHQHVVHRYIKPVTE